MFSDAFLSRSYCNNALYITPVYITEHKRSWGSFKDLINRINNHIRNHNYNRGT